MESKKARKTIRQQLDLFRPKNLAVGASVGAVVPFIGGRGWHPGPSASLQAVTGFSERLRMQLQGGWAKPRFESTTIPAALGIPDIDPPTSDFKLISVEAQQADFQFSAEIQWVFFPQKRWRPMVGLGLGAVWRQPFQATYDFRNTVTGTEWIKEEAVAGDSPLGFRLVTAGLERAFSKKWSGQMRAGWQIGMGTARPKRPDVVEFQVGTRYRF